MNTRSLKFRLVAWYAGWLTALFVVFGFFVYGSLDYYLERAVREGLTRRARQTAELVQRSPLDWDVLGPQIATYFAPEENNRLTRVTVDGMTGYVSGPPSDGSFDPSVVPPAAAGQKGEFFERRLLPDGNRLFVVVIRKVTPDEHIVVEEGFAERPVKATLQAWLVALVAGLLVLILGAVLGGFMLVQRALRPVDEIIGSAERLSLRNLSERLPVPQTRDELERLSIALNNMIRRLDDSLQQTRRFLADASHELRTPLTMMRAELEAIRDKAGQVGSVEEIAESALEEVERLQTIVEGLFALSRLEAGEAVQQFVRFDLAEIAASTTEHMSLLAQDKGIAIRCDTPGKVIVEGDRARLKQVTVNLLDNAIKYTPNGGTINVSVTARDGAAVMEVSDNGIGIAAEALPRVFDRFFRADKGRSRESGGAGLGLSIVKSICAAHGGRVDVESREGQGTRFTVELPLAQDRRPKWLA